MSAVYITSIISMYLFLSYSFFKKKFPLLITAVRWNRHYRLFSLPLGAAYLRATEEIALWENKYDLYVIQPWINTTEMAITNSTIKQRLQHENADILYY